MNETLKEQKCAQCGAVVVECSECGGTGEYVDSMATGTCEKCKGSGYRCPTTGHGANWQ